ncbi:MAG: alpha/beta hydrolase [Proteobacteria bacterium]|nr:alpha/beta hydrolase [Pseudomonadota bacterium]
MPKIDVGGVNIHYEDRGRGEALVFMHGYTGSGRDWRNQVEALAGRCRTVTVDARGHGDSDAPTSEEQYSIEIASRDARAVMDHLGIGSCCLVGHSMGGFAALQFVLDDPDRVKALVLVDTSSGDYDVPSDYPDLKQTLYELARTEGLEAAFEYEADHNPIRIDRFAKHPELRDVARAKVLQTSVDGYVYVSKSFGKWQPVSRRLGEIRVPTLIFWGREDAGFERPSQALKNGIPDARLVIVPGVGHNPHEEAPEVFNQALLAFLDEIGRPA